MKLVVISPEQDHPRERAVLGELFAAGLERYHVRKPQWSRAQLETWLREVLAEWRPRLVLHSHHGLACELGLGGVHFRDEPVGRGVPAEPSHVQSASVTVPRSRAKAAMAQPAASPYPRTTSRSCHDLATLRAALGHFDSVFLSPVFPSLSKPGHAPHAELSFAKLSALLAHRAPAERRTAVLALGGITSETAPRALELGFDGVAVLGAIWLAPDPVRAFAALQNSLVCHAA